MIVPMKKVTLVIMRSDKISFLNALRRLGAVHIKQMRPPAAAEIDSVNEKLDAALRALSILEPLAKSDRMRSEMSEDRTAAEVARTVELADELEENRKTLYETTSALSFFKDWGSFSPDEIKAMAEKGVYIKLYKSPKKEFKAGEPGVFVISGKETLHIAYITDDKGKGLPYEEVALPGAAYSRLMSRKEDAKTRITQVLSDLSASAGAIGPIKELKTALEQKKRFLAAAHGMDDKGEISVLQGFVPEDRSGEVAKLASANEAAYMLEAVSDDPDVPTLVRNPAWIRIISPVFKLMNIVPGYKEFDASVPFLFFFSLFFAMLIGDAGYGVLMLLATVWARKKLKKAPAEPFFLMYVLSTATIIWGVMSGTYFAVESFSRAPVLKDLIVDKLYSFGSGNEPFMMQLCFTIGAVHLSIAHLMIAARVINSMKALAEAGWIMIIWGIYFTAGALILNKPFPVLAGYALYGGIGMVLVFANFQKNVLKGMGTTIIDLPLKVIAVFSDVVSYLRLFAVGYASCVVAASFNEMAIGSGFSNVIAGLGQAMILFFGHALNIVLGCMAVIVHGLRLNMLEFAGHLGMEWSGRDYEPFRD